MHSWAVDVLSTLVAEELSQARDSNAKSMLKAFHVFAFIDIQPLILVQLSRDKGSALAPFGRVKRVFPVKSTVWIAGKFNT